MRLTNRLSIGVFCIAITLFAIGMATGLEYFLYPKEFATTARGKKEIIVSAISLPIAWAIGEVIRKNQLLTDELSALVNRDRLTNVATRDYFFAQMNAAPNAYGVSLMIDIDKFKSINDTYGHFSGDAVIRHVATLIKNMIRAEDIVCRFGGEEFIVFLYDQDRASGVEVAERMREAIAADPVSPQHHRISVTVSIGGSLKDRLSDVDEAIQRADDALYRAKSGGRNRTVFATESGPQRQAPAA